MCSCILEFRQNCVHIGVRIKEMYFGASVEYSQSFNIPKVLHCCASDAKDCFT